MKSATLCVVTLICTIALSLATTAPVDARAAGSPIIAVDDTTPVEDSMHEFMEYVFQPTYLRLKASIAAGPADNKSWKAVKSDSLILAESCNLLFNRKPEEHGDDWVKHAIAAKSGGAELYEAAKSKDLESAKTAWITMLNNCNACHKQFEDGKHILQP